MMVVSDIHDVFVPMSEGLFVDPQESKAAIETLLSQLPSLHQHNLSSSAVFGPAVQSALLALKSLGGKVSIIQSTLPSLGPGALKNRDDPKLYGTEREKSLFAPQDSFYTQLASECVQSGVSMDVWLFPPANTYIDVATVGVLSALTGGDTHYFPNFNPAREGVQFAHDFMHSINREQGYRSALRLRCSNGKLHLSIQL
jgi:protein transport protein SEC24